MICDFKEEVAWHHMRKAWVSYTQRHHCVPGYPVLLPCKWNKVVSKPGWTCSSLGRVVGAQGFVSPTSVLWGREWQAPAGSRTSQQLGATPAQFNARNRQPMLSQTSPSPPYNSVGEDGDTAAKNVQPHPLSRALPVLGFTMANDHKICCCLR